MRFTQRKEIADKYREWVKQQIDNNQTMILDCAESVIAFLDINGYLTSDKGKRCVMDLISRQDAIMHFVKASKYYECGIFSLEDVTHELWEISSAEPEIIRCKDCKYWHQEIHNGIEYFNFSSCDLNHYGDGHNFYCADAERRTNETD